MIGSLLVLTTLTSACAMTGAELREKARADYTVPSETSDLQLQQDLDRCNKEADEKSRSLAMTSVGLSAAGIIVWPLLIPAIALAGASAGKANSAKAECMGGAGYVKK